MKSECVSVEVYFVIVKAWIVVFPGTCLFFCNHELKFLSPLVKICVRVVCFTSSEIKKKKKVMHVYMCYICSRLPRIKQEKKLTGNRGAVI